MEDRRGEADGDAGAVGPDGEGEHALRRGLREEPPVCRYVQRRKKKRPPGLVREGLQEERCGQRRLADDDVIGVAAVRAL